MVRAGRTVAFAFAVLTVVAAPAAAQMFRWIDDQGNAHYVEGLLNVPDRYRARAEQLGLRQVRAHGKAGFRQV